MLARGTPGFSGADLANLVNEAALLAARLGKKKVVMADFDEARDKILMGAERRTMAMTEQEKALTAYHEAGHTIVGLLVPDHDPVYKVTIIPRGRALGVTMYLPERDSVSYSKQKIESSLSCLFGGRVAEKLIYGEEKVTTGASNDISKATELAHNMVVKWGLSSLGPQMFSEDNDQPFLGHSMGLNQKSTVSDATAQAIDQEVRAIIARNYQRAEKLLKANIDILHAMAEALIKFETLESPQINQIMRHEEMTPPPNWSDAVEASEPQESTTPVDQSKDVDDTDVTKAEDSQKDDDKQKK